MGRFATGTSCLALVWVIGRSRVPRPPLRISPFIRHTGSAVRRATSASASASGHPDRWVGRASGALASLDGQPGRGPGCNPPPIQRPYTPAAVSLLELPPRHSGPAHPLAKRPSLAREPVSFHHHPSPPRPCP